MGRVAGRHALPERETERLRLRQFGRADLDDLAAILAKPEVMKYLGLTCKPMTREETEAALLSVISHWQRQGFGRWAAEEKARASLRFGFQEMGFGEVVAFTRPGNLASRRVLEKIGMIYGGEGEFFRLMEGTGEAYVRPSGAEEIPLSLYSLTRAQKAN